MVHPHVVCCHRQIRKWELYNAMLHGREDKEKNLKCCRGYHAKKYKTNSEHVRVLTEKWREMALWPLMLTTKFC